MSHALRRPLPRWRRRDAVRAGLLMGIATAILLMHSVVVHCVTGSAAGAHHGATPSHHQSVTVQAAAQPLGAESMGASDDCGVHQHACVFVRAGEPAVLLLAVLVLWWGFPVPPLLQSVHTRLRIRAGRPPPWAMPTHLQLQVIRC